MHSSKALYSGMINPTILLDMVKEWLREDIPSFDVGGAVVGGDVVEAVLLAKSHLVLAGFPFAEALVRSLSCTVAWLVAEGAVLDGSGKNKIPIARLRGPANALLQAERTVLEVLSRSSACATETRKSVVRALSKNKAWKGKVACTRKTTPGAFREVEKYGVLVGGGDMHRYCLSSMVMLKDNHIDVCGGITGAVHKALSVGGFSLKVEVECRSVEDAVEACRAGAHVVMLDNFSAVKVRQCIDSLHKEFPHVLIECSGGITSDTIADYAIDGVSVISSGKLTHGVPAVDISMEMKIPQAKL